MINIKNIEKRYDDNLILNGLSLDIEEGESILITGENGVGKTTLLRIMALLDFNYNGEYFIKGTDTKKMKADTVSEYRNKFFGFSHQREIFMEDETVRANIEIPLKISEANRDEKVRKLDFAVQFLELEGILDKQTRFLSGGERKKISIARAIINEPEVLILDEPFSSLSEKLVIKLLGYVEERIENNKSNIIVTHDFDAIKNLNIKKMILENGRLTDC